MSVDGQLWPIQRGQDSAVEAVGTDSTNPTGWGLLFSLFEYPGQVTPVYSTNSVPVSGPNSDGAYTLTITLARSQTIGSNLPNPAYFGGVWRTDTGANIPLFGFTLIIKPPTRTPV